MPPAWLPWLEELLPWPWLEELLPWLEERSEVGLKSLLCVAELWSGEL
jgi:hypothetical protein